MDRLRRNKEGRGAPGFGCYAPPGPVFSGRLDFTLTAAQFSVDNTAYEHSVAGFQEEGETSCGKEIPMGKRQLTAIIEREGDGYVALCPELDIASQGESIEEARNNLQEAIELFCETASPEEVKQRLHEEIYVTRLEIAVG